jgi:hypothetical protein
MRACSTTVAAGRAIAFLPGWGECGAHDLRSSGLNFIEQAGRQAIDAELVLFTPIGFDPGTSLGIRPMVHRIALADILVQRTP